jgi:hypothetical protein
VEASRALAQAGCHVAALRIDRPAHHFFRLVGGALRALIVRVRRRGFVTNRCLEFAGAIGCAFQRISNDYGHRLVAVAHFVGLKERQSAHGRRLGIRFAAIRQAHRGFVRHHEQHAGHGLYARGIY